MFHRTEKILRLLSGWEQWYRLSCLFVFLLSIYMVSSCRSATSWELYENSELGISLKKPAHWSLEFNERNGSIVLKAETGIWNQESALIAINGTAGSLSYDSRQELDANIDRIRTRYNLDAAVIIQEPTLLEDEKYEMATATVLILTTSIPEDSTANQMGSQEADLFQTIDMRTVKCPDNFAITYIYEGNSEQLNAEAEAIVDSIQLTCSAEP